MPPDPLVQATAAHRTLAEVIAWGLAQSPPAQIADVITQDEYTLDVLLPVNDRWIVYDTT